VRRWTSSAPQCCLWEIGTGCPWTPLHVHDVWRYLTACAAFRGMHPAPWMLLFTGLGRESKYNLWQLYEERVPDPRGPWNTGSMMSTICRHWDMALWQGSSVAKRSRVELLGQMGQYQVRRALHPCHGANTSSECGGLLQLCRLR